MINIIIGKESNLTNASKKQLCNTVVFSARDSSLIGKIKLLNKYKKINLELNNYNINRLLKVLKSFLKKEIPNKKYI